MAKCPHIQFDDCPESSECKLWIEFPVKDNARGLNIVKGDCSYNWQAILLYDSQFKLLGVQQATEDFRNKVVQRTDDALRIASINSQKRLES